MKLSKNWTHFSNVAIAMSFCKFQSESFLLNLHNLIRDNIHNLIRERALKSSRSSCSAFLDIHNNNMLELESILGTGIRTNNSLVGEYNVF